ncbi:MAG TPA: HAD-IA family hydrolase [Ktedonobacteraceae bacterium]
MTARPAIFLDDGAVMNDNRLRGPQWQQRVGEFFSPRLGGSPTAWAQANRVVAAQFAEPAHWQARVQAAPDYASFERTYQIDWLGDMCRFVGIAPPSAHACIELAVQAEAYITQRVQAAFPGAIEAIRALHTRGYTLHTASGEPSAHLQGYLAGMGIRACFGRLYGPDLLTTLKETPEFYERLFADVRLTPGEALIVDDNPQALARARALGATTILVMAERQPVADEMLWISSLAALPALLQRLGI